MRVFGFAVWSGSGKTTLIERLVPHLVARGMAVSLVKHAHHEFDVDQPGKDSWRHRNAGCREVLVSYSVRYALMHELRGGISLASESGHETRVLSDLRVHHLERDLAIERDLPAQQHRAHTAFAQHLQHLVTAQTRRQLLTVRR